MRIRLLTTTLTLFALTVPVTAQTFEDMAPAEGSALNETYEKQTGWNRWVCWAQGVGYWGGRSYSGSSYYFQAGSGEGQEAQSVAQLMALRNCEFRAARYYRNVDCEVRNCRVQRY